MTIGERLQQYRKNLGLSQEELGQRLFVSRQTVSQWETDQTLPTVDNLIRLKELFGVSVDTILCGNAPEATRKPRMRTRKRVWIILQSALLGAALLIWLAIGCLKYLFPQLYYRVYLGDRIQGTVTVSLDGEFYPLKTGSIIPYDPYVETPRVTYRSDGSARVRIHSGAYGMYGFCLTIDGVAQPIHITAYQFNWWNVTSFDLSVSIDTEANTVTFSTVTEQLHNNGTAYTYVRTQTFPLSESEIVFSIVDG